MKQGITKNTMDMILLDLVKVLDHCDIPNKKVEEVIKMMYKELEYLIR